MLLTKDQQKHITETLSKVASRIREEQDKERESFSKKKEGVVEQVSSFTRGIHHGKMPALEKCYHIAKTASEESYAAEYHGADQEIESVCKQMEAQAKYLEELHVDDYADTLTSELSDKIEEQAELTKQFVKKIRLILHLSENSSK